MAGPFTETFSTDGAGWSSDLTWTTSNGTPLTLFTQATSNETGAGASTNASANAGVASAASSANNEARVSANLMELSYESIVGVAVRVGGFGLEASSYQFLRIGAPTLGEFAFVLRKQNGGTPYVLSGPTAYARAATNTPEVIKLQVVVTPYGQLLTAYIDGVQVASYVDSTNMVTVGTLGGLIIRSAVAANTYADNWVFGDIGTTGGPVALTGKAATSSSAKAVVKTAKIISAKTSTSNRVVSVLGVTSKHITRTSTSFAVRASLSTVIEGFNVIRPLVAKVGSSSRVTAFLNTERATKTFAGKMATTSSAKALFRRRLGYVTTALTISSSGEAAITGVLTRDATMSGLMFQSSSATSRLTGRTPMGGTIPTASSILVMMAGGRNAFAAVIPLGVSSIYIIEFGEPVEPEYLYVFEPPVNPEENPPVLPSYHVGNRLFRHYRSRPVGRNVYIYSNNVVSETDPDGFTTLWRESDRTSDTAPNASHVIRVFWGGHDAEVINAAERTLLIAAGYTTGLVPV